MTTEREVNMFSSETAATDGSGTAGHSASVEPIAEVEECAGAGDDRRPVSRREMRDRHSRYLESLIDRGHGLAIDMHDDAVRCELEDLKRIEYVRMADRISETVRKLIVGYDKHVGEEG